MNLHEFQAKQVLSQHGVPVLPGRVAENPAQAAEAFRALGVPAAAVKAQIHAGGRGKAGGVKVVRSADDAAAFAEKILGRPLVTHQTGPQGRIVRRVYVEAGADIAREFYLGIVLDRRLGRPVVMASAQGGVEIEEVAARDPQAILREAFDVSSGLWPYQVRRLAYGLGLSGETAAAFGKLVAALAKLYVACDCSMVEINPLAVTKQGGVLALDGKISIDDRAIELKKQAQIAAMRDINEEDPLEREASEAGLNYVSMEGNIGCLVNGAGLAMSTMDIIKLAGGQPANFLDVGGGATKDQVKKAFQMLLSNASVKAILVNIFGGILKCDVLAQGIVDAVKEVQMRVPLVVRLEGTNVAAGREILQKSGLRIESATDMDDAAKKVIRAAGLSQ